MCGRCGEAYSSTEWLGLELAEVLDSQCVRQVLTDWPPGDSIEVRYCWRCSGEIARAACSGASEAADHPRAREWERMKESGADDADGTQDDSGNVDARAADTGDAADQG